MTVYVLSWENSDMETLVFSSFEKAYQVAKFIREQLSSFKVTWTEEEEGYSLVWHFEHQGDEESDEFSNDEADKDNSYGEDLAIYPCELDIGLSYLKN